MVKTITIVVRLPWKNSLQAIDIIVPPTITDAELVATFQHLSRLKI